MTDFNAAEMVSTATADKEIRRTKLESLRERGLINGLDLMKDFEARCAERRATPPLNTGIAQLDRLLGGLMPGYYAIGGPTGTGKTALAMQIAGNVAQSGRRVMIVSMEMNPDVLLTRDYARLSAQRDENGTCGPEVTAITYLMGLDTDPAASVKEWYAHNMAANIEIYAPDFGTDTTGAALGGMLGDYIGATGETPALVVIDYLQILQTPGGLTDKQAIDANIRAISAFAVQRKIPVLLLSSFNRSGSALGKTSDNAALSGSALIEYQAEATLLLDAFRTAKDDRGEAYSL